MIQAAIELAEHDSAVRAYAVLDRAHLSRMTFDDRSLEREVLQLFERQAELLMTRMRNSGPAAIATLAHTLKGSAVGIGAARVAQSVDAGALKALARKGLWVRTPPRAHHVANVEFADGLAAGAHRCA